MLYDLRLEKPKRMSRISVAFETGQVLGRRNGLGELSGRDDDLGQQRGDVDGLRHWRGVPAQVDRLGLDRDRHGDAA